MLTPWEETTVPGVFLLVRSKEHLSNLSKNDCRNSWASSWWFIWKSDEKSVVGLRIKTIHMNRSEKNKAMKTKQNRTEHNCLNYFNKERNLLTLPIAFEDCKSKDTSSDILYLLHPTQYQTHIRQKMMNKFGNWRKVCKSKAYSNNSAVLAERSSLSFSSSIFFSLRFWDLLKVVFFKLSLSLIC